MRLGRTAGLCVAVGGAVAGLGGGAAADLTYEEVVRGPGTEVRRETTLSRGRRRIVSRARVSGALALTGARPGETHEITRLDRDTVWTVDPRARTYQETSFEQVRRLVAIGAGQGPAPVRQPLKALYQAGTPEMKVTPSEATRAIAGFRARRVDASMVVPLRNTQTGTRARVHFAGEVWLTEDAHVLDEVRRFERACAEKVGTAESLARIRHGAGPWMDALVPHVRELESRVRALDGFPMASKMTVTWETVPQKPGERATRTNAGTLSSEVTAVRMTPAPDAFFELPAGYQPAAAAPSERPLGPQRPAQVGTPAASPPATALRGRARTKPAKRRKQPAATDPVVIEESWRRRR